MTYSALNDGASKFLGKNGRYKLYDQQTEEQENLGELKTVFENGKLIQKTSLKEIRALIDGEIKN